MKNLPQADGVFDTVRNHGGFLCVQAFAGKVNSNSWEIFGGARRMLTGNDPSSRQCSSLTKKSKTTGSYSV